MKFPLASKCGYIRKLVAEAQDADLSIIDICDIPGGAEAFELAAKFCYGINFEVSTTNIAMLRCAAEYLQMTEDYANANLVSRAEAYINEVIPKDLVSAVTVLRFCEKLLPMAEDLKIVSRCIETVASKASKESSNGSPGRVDSQGSTSSRHFQIKPVIDWWLEEIVVLRIDFFQRVITAMKRKGLKHGTVGAALMFYAQKSLRGLDIFGRSRKKIEHEEEQGQRILVETIVSLLPTEKNYISVSFLCWLLRTAIYLETTVACKLELEQRIGLQLEQATLDDLLIPSFSYNGDTVYAVDSMQRIVFNFLEQEKHCDLEMLFVCGPNEHFSSSFTDLIKVSNLLENYLAEIAPDKNLSIAKFTALAELIPKKARTIDDGIYRAIDIYLKAHPSLNESECKKVSSIMDCQKLSREACAHAAQNERLPVQIVVQVLYFEQQQLRNAVSGTLMGREAGCQSKKVNYSARASSVHSPRNEFIELRQENQDLKLEIARLRMQLSDLEKDRSSIKLGTGRPPQYNKKFLNSVSRKLGKLNPFTKLPDSTIQPKLAKERRYSIS